MTKVLINSDTGELLNAYNDDEYLVALSPKKVTYKKLSKMHFYKLSVNSVAFFLNANISGKVKVTFFNLITLLELNKGEVLMVNGTFANLKMISMILRINSRTLFNHLKELEKYNIVRKIKNGRSMIIAVNPFFLMYGEKIYGYEFKKFKESLWVDVDKKINYNNIMKIDNKGEKIK